MHVLTIGQADGCDYTDFVIPCTKLVWSCCPRRFFMRDPGSWLTAQRYAVVDKIGCEQAPRRESATESSVIGEILGLTATSMTAAMWASCFLNN